MINRKFWLLNSPSIVLMFVATLLMHGIGALCEPAKPLTDAKVVMEKMRETYAALRSYRDTGVIKSVILPERVGDASVKSEATFSTRYMRGRKVKFEYEQIPQQDHSL